jgi:uncharacterized membrane protein
VGGDSFACMPSIACRGRVTLLACFACLVLQHQCLKVTLSQGCTSCYVSSTTYRHLIYACVLPMYQQWGAFTTPNEPFLVT